MSLFGSIGSVRAIAVQLARSDAGQIAVPDLVGAFGQVVARDFLSSRRIEEAQLDAFGVRREHGEVDAVVIDLRAQGIRQARQDAVRRMPHRSISVWKVCVRCLGFEHEYG